MCLRGLAPKADWKDLPREDWVLYERHVGAFSEESNFVGVKKHSDYLVDTAIQLMRSPPLLFLEQERACSRSRPAAGFHPLSCCAGVPFAREYLIAEGGGTGFRIVNEQALLFHWLMNDGTILTWVANLTSGPVWLSRFCRGEGAFASEVNAMERLEQSRSKPWAMFFLLAESDDRSQQT